ncbi:MAG: hypothetical protein ABSB57_00215 [Dehalococcoidia bacterium]
MEEKLRLLGTITDNDIVDALGLQRDDRAILREPIAVPWLPAWKLPLVGSISGARGLQQAFLAFAVPAWVLFASVLTAVGAT